MAKPDLEYLSQIDWRVWGTLTFKGEKTTRVKEVMYFAHLRDWCSLIGAHFPGAWWVRRSELGEMGGRHHFHYLIGGKKFERVNVGMCFAMMDKWLKLGGGWARIEPYDNGFAKGAGALDYMLKCLNGGRAYETGKFTEFLSSGLLLSNALFSDLKMRAHVGRRYLSAGGRCLPRLFWRELAFADSGAVVPRVEACVLGSGSPALAITGHGSVHSQ